MATELWRCAWPGNPATKKNTPLPLMFCLCGDGNKRQIGALLNALKATATRNTLQWRVLLEAVKEPGEKTLDRLLWIEQLIGAQMPGPAASLLADLEAVTGEGGRQTVILPEESYRKAVKEVVPQLRRAWGERPPIGGKDQPLWIEAHYFIGPRQRPDGLSLNEAAADLLQAAGVITNDSWIESWDGTRRHKDQRGNPRTEIVIREFVATTTISRGVALGPPIPGLFDQLPS